MLAWQSRRTRRTAGATHGPLLLLLLLCRVRRILHATAACTATFWHLARGRR
jgi:hypothetical protein